MSFRRFLIQKRSLSGMVNQHAQVMQKLKLQPANSGVYYGKWVPPAGKLNVQVSPSTGEKLGEVSFGTATDYENCIAAMDAAKKEWMLKPAPLRCEVVRRIGEKLREHKHELGMMISLEMGKILTEGLGEVQEAIDICDYAVGLSRALNGAVIPSERPGHAMMERYNPLKGHVGIISAFNFPVAVYFWNLAISLVCGNAMIVDKSANIDMAVRATLFGAVGTAGQRCTSQRRVYLHKDIYDSFLAKLIPAYGTVKIGSPLDPDTLCGPIINQNAVNMYKTALETATNATNQGKVLCGGKVLTEMPGNFVAPTVIAVPTSAPCVMKEVFVPILYVMKVDTVEEAMELNNSVDQGLSSALFTQDIGQMFDWTGPIGSDCGIVNVNIGTSGAEIGGAFGGEKETGGGRESGSDAWKAYMRRSTCTINHSKSLPLAQGVNF